MRIQDLRDYYQYSELHLETKRDGNRFQKNLADKISQYLNDCIYFKASITILLKNGWV